MNQSIKYKGTIIAIILCLIWMAITAIIGTLGLYEYLRFESHLSIIISVITPSIIYGILYIFNSKVRTWTKNLSLAMLVLPHAWRTVGFTFLTLWAYKTLPAGFAAPAGFGDFAIAIAAPFVAVALWMKWKQAIKTAVIFHVLGFIDLFFAILTGASGYGISADKMNVVDPMTAFPLVIITTVFVPLLVLSHVISLTKIISERTAIHD